MFMMYTEIHMSYNKDKFNIRYCLPHKGTEVKYQIVINNCI